MLNTEVKRIDVVAGIVRRNQDILIALRPKQLHKGGYWEFPGGKIDHRETQFQALQRELSEELGITVTEATFFQDIRFDYPEKSVHLYFWEVFAFDGEPSGQEGQEVRWVALKDIADYQFPEANQAIVDALLAGLNE